MPWEFGAGPAGGVHGAGAQLHHCDSAVRLLWANACTYRPVVLSCKLNVYNVTDVMLACRVWDVATGKCMHTLEEHTDVVKAVALSLDGRIIGVGRDYGQVHTHPGGALKICRLCRLKPKWQDHVLGVQGQDPQHCSAHTCYCATGCWARALGARSRSFFKPIVGYSLPWAGSLARCFHLHSSSGRPAMASPATMSARIARSLHNGASYSISISTLLLHAHDKHVLLACRVWDLATGTELYPLKGHTGWVTCLTVSSDGKLLASGSSVGDHIIRVWDMDTRKCKEFQEGHNLDVQSVAFNPDASILVSGSNDFTIK
ncbi:WD_REPEATS_REGION domain-containing protein [Haematococcus lacustris]|uniref:WD_REPEATS_REGION domain-containing protein n=1 Tax=Haematococcus lacustris TaxID=44745 RepID=A0A699YZU1_HAELA|nr:WD_REPEATS_REGION domain-containing protein [Haematococcus lacustris]